MAIITAEDYFIEGCKNLSVKHQKYSPFYQNSKGNDFKAKELFEKSADLGYAPAMRELGRCYIEGYGIWIKNKLAKGHALLCKAIFAGDKDALKYYWEKECEYRFADIKDEDAVQNHREVQRLLLKKEEEEEAARKAKAKAKRQAKKEAESKKQEEAESKAKEIEVSKQNKKSKSEVHEKENLDTDIVALFEESESTKKSKKENKAQSKPTKKSATSIAKKTKSMSESDDEDIDRKIDAIFEDKVEEVDDDTSKSKSSSQSHAKGSVKAKQSKKEVEREAKDDIETAREAKIEAERKAKEEEELKNQSQINQLIQNAENGNSDACYNLYQIYKNGTDFQKIDVDKSIFWLEKAAEYGMADAMFKLAVYYEDIVKNQYQASIWYEKTANIGNSDAMNKIGYYYFKGIGVKQNLDKAAYWFEKSAESGNANAMCNIAAFYLYGGGKPRNTETAMHWYLKSAKLGNPKAMFFLGKCYMEGLGPNMNYEKAINWYKKSAKLEYLDAILKLCVLYYREIQSDTNNTNSIKNAKLWHKKCIESGILQKMIASDNLEAMFIMGNCLLYGWGVEKDEINAVYWFERSANSSNKDAMFQLACCYWFGTGIKQNLPKAVELFENVNDEASKQHIKDIKSCKEWNDALIQKYTQPAESGDSNAMNILAHAYSDGKEENRDYEKCYYWYKKSAELGNKNSQANLGWCYQFGHGTSVDYEEAIRWYKEVDDEWSNNHIEQIKSSSEWKRIVAKNIEAKALNADAQYKCLVARWYQYGENDLPIDRERAIYWYQMSAMSGNTSALSFMNMLLSEKNAEIIKTQQEDNKKFIEQLQSKLESERIQRLAAEQKIQQVYKEKAEANKKYKDQIKNESNQRGELCLDEFEYLGKYETYKLDYSKTEFLLRYYFSDGSIFKDTEKYEYLRWVRNGKIDVYMKIYGSTKVFRVKDKEKVYQLAHGSFRGVIDCHAHCRKPISYSDYKRKDFDVEAEFVYDDFNSQYTNDCGIEIRLNV